MSKREFEFPAVTIRDIRTTELRFMERRAIAFRFFTEVMPNSSDAASFEFIEASKERVFSVPVWGGGGSLTLSPGGEPLT